MASGAAPRWLQTTSAAAGSFTSTTLTPVTVNQIAELSTEEEARQRYDYLKTVKKQKGYVQLQTSHGSINIELHCDTVPMTCENFISLYLPYISPTSPHISPGADGLRELHQSISPLHLPYISPHLPRCR